MQLSRQPSQRRRVHSTVPSSTRWWPSSPFGDPALRDMHVLRPTARVNLTYELIVRLAARFTADVDAEWTKEEYEDFKLLGKNDITLVEDGNGIVVQLVTLLTMAKEGITTIKTATNVAENANEKWCIISTKC